MLGPKSKELDVANRDHSQAVWLTNTLRSWASTRTSFHSIATKDPEEIEGALLLASVSDAILSQRTTHRGDVAEECATVVTCGEAMGAREAQSGSSQPLDPAGRWRHLAARHLA